MSKGKSQRVYRSVPRPANPLSPEEGAGWGTLVHSSFEAIVNHDHGRDGR